MLDDAPRMADAAGDLIAAHYADFNDRRLDAVLNRFAPDAPIEHITGRVGQGPGEYGQFLARFLEAFPDAHVHVEEIHAKGRGFHDVRLVVTGTHTGTLTFGTWLFQPTGFDVRLPARELFQVVNGRFQFASVSFDLHDLVRQLSTVDTKTLVQHIARIHQLGEELARAADNPFKKRELIDRLGHELDSARHVVRPYFR
jgi:predicted ester cyclase